MSNEQKNTLAKGRIWIRYIIHVLLTGVVAAGVAWVSNEVILEDAWNNNYFIFSGVILAVIFLCSLLERKIIYGSLRLVGILVGCFTISALLLLLSDFYVNLPIWLLGGIVASALVNRNIGMLYLYYFVYHAIYLQGDMLYGLVFHFAVATLIAFFIPKMKSFLGMCYMMAFTACIIVTGATLYNHICDEKVWMLDIFYILCTYLACILITMLLVKWFGTDKIIKSEEIQEINDYSYLDILAEETAKLDAQIAENYSLYCDEKAELLLELKNKNKAVYAQGVLVGKIAEEISQKLGLDAELTKAAGLYKKIGKIKADKTSSVEVAREYNFPEELVQLIGQLNENEIKQKEAAVLLITEGVISYYTIVRHVQKKEITIDKIVDTVLSKKIFQGEFNESGLSVQECFLLREKLINLLETQDNKRTEKGKEEAV